MSAHPYALLAELLEYPGPDVITSAERCRAALAPRNAGAAASIERFAGAASGHDARELEELYARTFDFNESRCMDLGYQIFGETYKRGAFLVKMKEAVRAHGVDPGVELHDHLPVVLRLLPLLSPEEDPVELASEVVLPAVEKILRSFGEGDDGAGWRSVLEAVKSALMADYGVTHVEPPRPTAIPTGGGEGRRLPVFPGFNPA